MSLLTRGVTKLSQIGIDADKDWNGEGIANLKELALGMVQGDLVVKGPDILIRLSPGVANQVLTSNGPGILPSWQPGGTYYNRYFPATLYLSRNFAKVAVAEAIGKNAAISRALVKTLGDDVAEYIKLLAPVLTTTKTLAAGIFPNEIISKSGPIKSDISVLCDGFVEETAAGIQTNHTAAARDATVSDLNLCPMTPAQMDKVYIGSLLKFRRVWINYGQSGSGNWTNTAYYWNGSAWVTVTAESDQTSSFQAASGIRRMDWTMPPDWALKTIVGLNLYWIMISTDNFVNQSTKPLGTQMWICPVA